MDIISQLILVGLAFYGFWVCGITPIEQESVKHDEELCEQHTCR